MPTYISFTCAKCQRTLKVRSAYLGQWVTCNRCEHSFLAEEVAGVPLNRSFEGLTAVAAPPPSGCDQILATPVSTHEGDAWASAERLEAEVQSAREENARLTTTVRVLKSELVERMGEVERLRRSADELLNVQAERDQGQAECRAALDEVEQLRARLAAMERSCEEVEARSAAACLEHARQREEALRLWEAERRDLVARWEEERRSCHEETARQRDEERTASLARQGLLHEEIEIARRQFEQEQTTLRDERDALQGDLAGLRAEREAAIAQAARLRDELDRWEGREGEWEQMLGEVECRRRAEIDALAHELRKARQQTDLALQHEGVLTHRLQVVQDELDQLRQEAAAASAALQAALDALRHELDARSREELSAERARSAQALESLRLELSLVRTDRDRFAEDCATAVTSLRALEDKHRGEFHALDCTLQAARKREELATRREVELLGELEGLRAELDQQRGEIEALEAQRDHAREQSESSQRRSDRLAAALDEAEARLAAGEVLHQAERAEATRALENARRKAEHVAQREADLKAQLQQLQAELDRQRLDIEAERVAHREGLATLRRDLEAESYAALAIEREQATSAAAALRDEVSSLHEAAARLQQECDAAIEQAGLLRLDRDQRHDSHDRLVTRLQEVEEHHRAEVERLSIACDEARQRAEAAARREAELTERLQSALGQRDRHRRDLEAFRRELRESSGPAIDSPGTNTCQDPIDQDVTESAGARHAAALPDEEERMSPAPCENAAAGVVVAEGLTAGAGPIGSESPEKRIQSLRIHLRSAHEARSRERLNQPFFLRLTRTWRKSDSPK